MRAGWLNSSLRKAPPWRVEPAPNGLGAECPVHRRLAGGDRRAGSLRGLPISWLDHSPDQFSEHRGELAGGSGKLLENAEMVVPAER